MNLIKQIKLKNVIYNLFDIRLPEVTSTDKDKILYVDDTGAYNVKTWDPSGLIIQGNSLVIVGSGVISDHSLVI